MSPSRPSVCSLSTIHACGRSNVTARPAARWDKPAPTGASRLSRVLLPPGVRAPATTGASGQSSVPLPPRGAQPVHSRGVQPVKRPPPAPPCTNQPQPWRATRHVSPSRPGVRAPATTGASCPSHVPLPPRRARTSHDRGGAAQHAQCSVAQHTQCATHRTQCRGAEHTCALRHATY